MTADLVAVGEMLVTVAGSTPGPLSVGASLRLSVAGAEGNALIAASRLGVSTAWMGRVGGDEGGALVLRTLRAEGVDVRSTVVDHEAPTALLLRHQRTSDVAEVAYYRRGGAGSRLSPEDVDAKAIRAARILHVTGITPALGIGPARAIGHAISLARAAGVRVSFDVNYRAKLWDVSSARSRLQQIARSASVVFASPAEIDILGVDPDDLLDFGVEEVVVKDGDCGAVVTTPHGRTSVSAHPVTVADSVGAGDAFVGAYLAATLAGLPIPARISMANKVGAVAVSTIGDWEGTPRANELDFLIGASDDVRR